MKYTHVDDHEHLEKFADMVTINHKKTYSPAELAKQAELLANAVQDSEQIELNKKTVMSEFKNQLDASKSNIKKLSSRVANGFEYADIPVTMFLDTENKRRVYFDPHTGNYVADEEFKASDYQREIDFENEEEQNRLNDIKRQQQIEENNQAGDFAEGSDQLDNVIGMKNKDHKPTPKDNLPDDYGKNQEPEDLPEDDLFKPDGEPEQNLPDE